MNSLSALFTYDSGLEYLNGLPNDRPMPQNLLNALSSAELRDMLAIGEEVE